MTTQTQHTLNLKITHDFTYSGTRTLTYGLPGIGIVGHLFIELNAGPKKWGYAVPGDKGKNYTKAAAMRHIMDSARAAIAKAEGR